MHFTQSLMLCEASTPAPSVRAAPVAVRLTAACTGSRSLIVFVVSIILLPINFGGLLARYAEAFSKPMHICRAR